MTKPLKKSRSSEDLTTKSGQALVISLQKKQIAKNQTQLTLLTDQLTEKQKHIEKLKKELERISQQLTTTTQELDRSLEIRHKNLQEWTHQQEQIKALSQELDETLDQVSTELEKGDSEISHLRTKIWTLKSAKEQLARELKLARIKSSCQKPNHPTDFTPNLDYLKYALYSLGAVWFIYWMTKKNHD